MGHVTNRLEPLPSRRGKVGNDGYLAVFFDIFNHEMDGLFIEGWLTEGCKSSPVHLAYQPPVVRTNQPLVIRQHYFSLKTNQHRPLATNQTIRAKGGGGRGGGR
jgi:hypothetical protein